MRHLYISVYVGLWMKYFYYDNTDNMIIEPIGFWKGI